MSVNAADQSVEHRDRFGDLFPLPLRAFEELFVHDDNGPNYPAVFSMRFYFEGEIDNDSAEKALAEVMARQPMLNVRLSRERDSVLQWVFASDRDTGIPRCSDQPRSRLQSIDLENEPPIRSGSIQLASRPMAALSKQKSRFSFIMRSQTESERLR